MTSNYVSISAIGKEIFATSSCTLPVILYGSTELVDHPSHQFATKTVTADRSFNRWTVKLLPLELQAVLTVVPRNPYAALFKF